MKPNISFAVRVGCKKDWPSSQQHKTFLSFYKKNILCLINNCEQFSLSPVGCPSVHGCLCVCVCVCFVFLYPKTKQNKTHKKKEASYRNQLTHCPTEGFGGIVSFQSHTKHPTTHMFSKKVTLTNTHQKKKNKKTQQTTQIYNKINWAF